MRTAEDIREEIPERYSIEQSVPEGLETAAFGMGCFWGIESLFGAVEGVYRTRVGYTGGEKDDPDYNSLGKHTETVQLDFNPEEVSYEELLEIFWNNHQYKIHRKNQYASRIFFMNEEQKAKAERSLAEHSGARTVVEPLEVFWVAEDYHQKYKLRSSDVLMNLFVSHSPEELIYSPLAAKLNGLVGGRDVEFEEQKMGRKEKKALQNYYEKG